MQAERWGAGGRRHHSFPSTAPHGPTHRLRATCPDLTNVSKSLTFVAGIERRGCDQNIQKQGAQRPVVERKNVEDRSEDAGTNPATAGPAGRCRKCRGNEFAWLQFPPFARKANPLLSSRERPLVHHIRIRQWRCVSCRL